MQKGPCSPQMKEILLSGGRKRSTKDKYIWDKLAIGESFTLSFKEAKKSTIVSLCYKKGKKLGCVFKVVEHKDSELLEVGRIA